MQMDQIIERNVQALKNSAEDDSRRLWVVIDVLHSKGVMTFHLRNMRPESFHRFMKDIWGR
jgi:hypothetical protein